MGAFSEYISFQHTETVKLWLGKLVCGKLKEPNVKPPATPTDRIFFSPQIGIFRRCNYSKKKKKKVDSVKDQQKGFEPKEKLKLGLENHFVGDFWNLIHRIEDNYSLSTNGQYWLIDLILHCFNFLWWIHDFKIRMYSDRDHSSDHTIRKSMNVFRTDLHHPFYQVFTEKWMTAKLSDYK